MGTDMNSSFADASFVAKYIDIGPPKFTPGHAGFLQMADLLLAEKTPADARLLIAGAGGGLEIRQFANSHPGWKFVGVDPSKAMLELAEKTVGPAVSARVSLLEGSVEVAPPGPFDAATLIFVLGIIPDDGSKLKLLTGIHERLKPGATFVLADQCFDRSAADFLHRLNRYAAYALASGVDKEIVTKARAMMESNASIVTAERDVQLLQEAGFKQVETFYKGMAWEGWLAFA